MYEEVFHRIILENVPNIFRVKRSLEAFINGEIEKHNLPKMKSLRLARTFNESDVTQGQMILFNSDDYEKLAAGIHGKEFMGHKLRTRVYRVMNVSYDAADVTVTLKLPPQRTTATAAAKKTSQQKGEEAQPKAAAEAVKEKGPDVKRKLQS